MLSGFGVVKSAVQQGQQTILFSVGREFEDFQFIDDDIFNKFKPSNSRVEAAIARTE